MRQPMPRSKPRKTELGSFPVPTAGLISNRNLAIPTGQNVPPGAAMLTNWFPTPATVVLRRGLARWATTPGEERIKSLFTYTLGAQKELFAATDSGIWDVTTVAVPTTPLGTPDRAATNGDWVVLQFSTSGGTFLIGVNGVDPGFIYDGTSFAALSVTGVSTSDLVYVWAYKNRVWFAEKGGLNAWYLSVDSIAGAATVFPLVGVFGRGGSLLWGQTWSLDTSGEGGLSEQCVFVSTEGEVAAYQGISPAEAATWNKVGLYRIGRPLGKKAFIRAGGDLVIATSIGFIGLSKAITGDTASLGVTAVSAPIADDWREAVDQRGVADWQCELWGEGSMVLVSPPPQDNIAPIVFVTNSDSGAWCVFDGWSAVSIESFDGKLFIGSTLGRVQQAYVTGSDEDIPYTGRAMPLFNDLGAPGSRKVAKLARLVTRSRFPTREQVVARFDWDMSTPAVPNTPPSPSGSQWDVGNWDEAIWAGVGAKAINEKWMSVGGSGYAASILVQITSGDFDPIDADMIRIEFTYETGDIVT